MEVIQEKIKEEKGAQAFIFTILVIILLAVSFFCLETYRIIELHDTVTTEMERASNIAVEYSMIDEARGYHLSKIDSDIAKEQFNEYFKERLGLNSSLEKYVDGQRLYRVQFNNFNIDLEKPEMSMQGTLYVDVQLIRNYVTIPIELPFKITSANINIEE